MKVISTPNRLRFVSFLILLSIPLVAVEVEIASRAPLWKMPLRNMGIWSTAIGIICVPIAFWIARGRRWAMYMLSGFGVAWSIMTVLAALQLKHPGLGFFSVFLLAYWGVVIYLCHHEMSRTFFDPQLHWYQGLPNPIPGLVCQLQQENHKATLRVCRLDHSGAFLFSDRDEEIPVSSHWRRKPCELEFQFGADKVKCFGLPVTLLGNRLGAGFRFTDQSMDLEKDLNDFVEVLRGAGYV